MWLHPPGSAGGRCASVVVAGTVTWVSLPEIVGQVWPYLIIEAIKIGAVLHSVRDVLCGWCLYH